MGRREGVWGEIGRKNKLAHASRTQNPSTANISTAHPVRGRAGAEEHTEAAALGYTYTLMVSITL